jgi:hypothetical protein
MKNLPEIKLNARISTNGRGYWSSRQAVVQLERMSMAYLSDESDFGELRVYFDTRDWDVDEHGLIYTDRQWLDEFRGVLETLGFSNEALYSVNYSEQGMQGLDYVSMDVTEQFIREYEPLYRFVINKSKVAI